MRETQVQSLVREDPLEKEMAAHSSTLAWKIPWMEKPDRLQSVALQRVGYDWPTSLCLSSSFKDFIPSSCPSLRLFILQKHEYQEALGVAYTILFGLVSKSEARHIITHSYRSANGVPAVWPCFPRFSKEKPGRHNVMIWPHVNMFFAAACAQAGMKDTFWDEVNAITRLTLEADSTPNFHEIYTVDGIPSGGWQCGQLWPPLNHQTWCATGMLRIYLHHIIGLQPDMSGLRFHPIGSEDGRPVVVKGIPYRNALLDVTIKGTGSHISSFRVNGKESKPFIPSTANGRMEITIPLN